jgi:MinD-like ATPase involved in chromosome partitioning or flagellar assembly
VSYQKAKVIAVWSPNGAPGRTTVAASIAIEFAKSGNRVLALDADSYAPTLQFQFGIDQNHSGIAAAARAAHQERLTETELNRLALDFEFGKLSLKIITGLSMPDRWQEVGYEGIQQIVAEAEKHFDVIVLDLAAPLEQQVIHELSLVQRNSMTISALRTATHIVAVCGAEVTDVHRFVWDYQQLKSLELSGELQVLVNKLRHQHGRNSDKQIAETIHRLTGCQVSEFLAHDQALADRAKAEGVPLVLAGRNSSIRAGLSKFVLTRLG